VVAAHVTREHHHLTLARARAVYAARRAASRHRWRRLSKAVAVVGVVAAVMAAMWVLT
jgi:hypothetical protein